MYTFKKLDKGIKNIYKNLVKYGEETPAGMWQGTKEFEDQIMLVLINYNFNFQCPKYEATLLDKTKADKDWVFMHFNERISGQPTNPGESYKIWPYAKFKTGDDFIKQDKFSHTYQERFWPKIANPLMLGNEPIPQIGIRFELGDLNDLINGLWQNKLTRQAYLPIFFPEDTKASVDGERVPCTLGYHFYMWKGKLNVNYYIRSCDAYRHLRNDIFFTGRLLQYVSYKIKEEVGEVNFFCANLHVFKNDLYNLKKRENYL